MRQITVAAMEVQIDLAFVIPLPPFELHKSSPPPDFGRQLQWRA